MRAVILTIHIIGVLILFAGLGLELVGLRQIRRSRTLAEAAPWRIVFTSVLRLYPAALALILLTGAWLATNVGVWPFAWVRISMATLVITTLMGTIGAVRVRSLYQRSRSDGNTARLVDQRLRASWLRASLGARGAAVLGIVYVMVAKPYFLLSLTVILVAAGLGVALTMIPGWRIGRATSDDIAKYAATRRQEV
jgi:uncharacterized membrane protein